MKEPRNPGIPEPGITDGEIALLVAIVFAIFLGLAIFYLVRWLL